MTTMPQHSVPDRHSTAARQLLLTASAVFGGRVAAGATASCQPRRRTGWATR